MPTLGNADLSGADLRRATLRRAILNRATLESADLRGADLSGVTGVTTERLEDTAYSLSGATMPDGSRNP